MATKTKKENPPADKVCVPADKVNAPKEHKKPWQETCATPEEIKAMLSERAILRYNEVRGRTEIHRLSQGLTIGENNQGLLTIFGGEGGITDGYRDLDDREENTLWDELCAVKPVVKQHLQNIINSNYVPAYHPFRYYLEHLPPWTPDKGDAIMGLSLTVNVKGDADEQILFYQYLKKWLVAMVASWVEPRVVNNVMLILIGVQGSYKTTWFAHLLPPQLRDYFYTKTDASILSKDDRLVLAQYGLMCWEELDSMLPKELNKLKGTMTMPSINDRAPYERYHKNRPHLASFCGTGNNVQFLSDTTGTRRWLPFEVESIEPPQENPLDYDAIYAQAYTLYQQGFRYWFSSEEIQQLTQHNRQFETSQSANELIDEHFRKPVGIEGGDFLPASVILQLVGGVNMRELSAASLGRALMAMGFESKLVHGVRRYRVVRRTEAEKELHRHLQEMGGEGGEVE